MTRILRGALLVLALLAGGAASPPPATWVAPAGETLYQDLGAGITTVVLSDPYPDGGRVLWACGKSVVAKLDASTFDVIATLRRPEGGSDDSGRREALIAAIDAGPPWEASARAAAAAPAQAAGPAPLLDADNRLIVSEERALIAYGDADPGARLSGIRTVQRFELAASLPGRLTGLTRAADGHLIGTTSAGIVVAVARGFSRLSTVRLEHAPSSDEKDWFRGGPVVDDRGGVYIATAHHLHRVAWDGANLSTDTQAGAWSAKVDDDCAAGAPPALPGGGAAGDRLVAVATDGRHAAIAAYWRETLPAAKPGAAPSRLAVEQEIPFIAPPPGSRNRARSEGSVTTARLFSSPDGLLAYDGDSGGLAGLLWDSAPRRFVPIFSSEQRPGGGVVLSADGRSAYFLRTEAGRTELRSMDTKGTRIGLGVRRALGGIRFDPRGATPILDPAGRLVSGCLFGVMRVKVDP
ncbi:MAG TPA: hypothetical protein VGS03_18580 [Candidatus Polarisedimenticolia bacterium]|nr:hypothetical protein [Candidatus Polarisedimenticolia bacterium]